MDFSDGSERVGFSDVLLRMYELVNLFSVAAPRENSGTDDERLMDKFNLDLPLVVRLGGLSVHRLHKGAFPMHNHHLRPDSDG